MSFTIAAARKDQQKWDDILPTYHWNLNKNFKCLRQNQVISSKDSTSRDNQSWNVHNSKKGDWGFTELFEDLHHQMEAPKRNLDIDGRRILFYTPNVSCRFWWSSFHKMQQEYALWVFLSYSQERTYWIFKPIRN